MENVKELLPIGSVVLLKKGKKRLMIYGIIQSDIENETEEYDYIGVPYPEGNMGPEYQYLYFHKDIEEIYFRGFEDIERQEFVKNLEKFYLGNNNP